MINKQLAIEMTPYRIRKIANDDFTRLRKIAHDAKIWTYFTLDLCTDEGLNKFYDHSNSNSYNGTGYTFIIENILNGDICGSTAFLNFSQHDQRVEIGNTWLLPAYQGTGINKHVKYMLLHYAFQNLQLHRVEFKTDLLNIQSRKALSKIGCTTEGVLRSHTLMHDGRYRDTIYYSILSTEWPKLKNSIFSNFSDLTIYES